jgi:hypothetical protein
MLPREDLSRIAAVEEAASSVLTLTEGAERTELGRSRVARHAVRGFLLETSKALGSLSPEAQRALPELDFGVWQLTGERLEAGEAVEGDTGWFAIQALMPRTLGWLRFYRESQPELFSGASGPG